MFLRGLWGLDNVLVIKREAAGKLDDFVLQTLFRFILESGKN